MGNTSNEQKFIGAAGPAGTDLPFFIADGAHVRQSAEELSAEINGNFPGKKFSFLICVSEDWDCRDVIYSLRPHADNFIIAAEDSRSIPQAKKLAEFLNASGSKAAFSGSVGEGAEAAAAGGLPAAAFGSADTAEAVRGIYSRAFRRRQRRAGINARNAIPEDERAEYSAAITENIAKSDIFRRARVVMLYKAMPGEADLGTLKSEGKIFAYPLCLNGSAITALHPADETAWRTGMYGITEPDPERSEVIAPEKIDLVICPCAGFDAEGNRIGMGKGYYDRFLPKCVNADIAAAAFEAQRLDALLSGPFDVRMDAVFTEKGVY